MESSNRSTATTSRVTGRERMSVEKLRRATFPQSLRGYDREAVHALLDRVADWVEARAGALASQEGMGEGLATVGVSTAGTLTAAEEAATNLRDEALEYAERLRADAEVEARKSRLNASQRMDEMIRDAESKAEKIIEEAVARRRKLNLATTSLLERRDEIVDEASRLAEEIVEAVDALCADEPMPAADPAS